MLVVTGIYCVVGGMYSVVMNDLIQFVLKVIAAIGIAVIAIVADHARADHGRRAGGLGPPVLRLEAQPGLVAPHARAATQRIYDPISQGGDGYSLFMFFTGMLFLKGRAGEHGRADAQLRHPAHPLDAQPARGGAGKHGHGRGVAGAAFPA